MVCLGNICRSPLAHALLDKYTSEKIYVDSAGTSSFHTNQQPYSRTRANALSHELDLSQLRARTFTKSDFNNFDHIYCMDRSNLKNVLSLAESQEQKQKVSLILGNEEVPDPYFGDNDQGFEHVYQLLDGACKKIASKIETL